MGDAVDRIVARTGVPDLVDLLGATIPGADFTSLMLEVMRRRAARLTPSDVMRRYDTDRFTAPASVHPQALRAAEDCLFEALPDDFEALVLSPVVPLGTHARVAAVDQHRVVATTRGTEVAADPTNALALEAASRRLAVMRDESRSPAPIRLAASQRVIRAQPFSGPRTFSHFQLFALVTAGRDTGGSTFELEHVVAHVAFAIAGLQASGADRVGIEVTDWDGRFGAVVDRLQGLAVEGAVDVEERPDRPEGRGYYDGLRFRAVVTFGTETFETGDGGLVDWTRTLVGSAKERCMISGLSVDRIALARR